LVTGLQCFGPTQTKTGVNGSFFLCDSSGHKSAIFKPMNMEAGGVKNHRLTASQNVQFRKSILPGQGAGNEALAYGLDKFAFGHHYEIPKTVLISLTHPAFEGRELGSAQKFLAGTCTLADLTPKEITDIPKHEWEKLNFRLISGSTDAHYGNILYSKTDRKLYLIDSGDDFVGEEGECQYWNPWAAEERCNQPMSDEESCFLRNLNISKVMEAFEWQAQFNEQASPVLKVSNDKYLTQILRLILAQAAGQNKLSQARWAFVMNPYRDPYGIVHRSPIEHIYDQYIRPYSGQPGNWKDISQMIDWKGVNKAIRAAI
ncbi:MAG: hypothetical protein WCK42_09755, partial [Myxococcaceae bacterium]